MNIVATLFDKIPNCSVFLARLKTVKGDKRRGRPPSWLSSFPMRDRDFVYALHTSRYPQIMYHLKSGSPNHLYEVTQSYFKTVKKMDLKVGNLDRVLYKEKWHIILSLMIHLQIPESEILLDKKLIESSVQNRKWVKDLNHKPIYPII